MNKQELARYEAEIKGKEKADYDKVINNFDRNQSALF